MANQWYVQHGGKQYGPMTSANLKKLATEGKIGPATSVRVGTDGAWVTASRVQGLFAAAAATPPAAPPTAPPVAPPPAPRVADPLARPAVPLGRAAVAPAARLHKAVPTHHGSVPAKVTGAVALVFGILALATCWLPLLGGLMGWTGIVVGGLGLLLGVGGLVLAATHQGSGLALGIAGTSSSVVGLVLAIVLGAHFGLFDSAPVKTVAVVPPVVQPPVVPVVKEAPPPAAPEPAPEPTWTDASEAITQGDIKATIVSAKVEKISLENADPSSLKRGKPQPMFRIRVAIENNSADKIVEFPGWMGLGDLLGGQVGQLLGGELGKAAQSAAATAVLADNFGNAYKQTSALRITGAAQTLGKDTSIRPGKRGEAELVFDPPLDHIEYVRLELSPGGFSGTEPLRFQIPKVTITGM